MDFYLLPTAEDAAREGFCCRLVDKAYSHGYRIFIRTPGPQITASLDQRLWTFRPGSFLPHATVAESNNEPIVIGEAAPAAASDVLINLAAELAEDWRRYPRIAEIVTQDRDDLDAARERYRHYRDAGAEPSYHRLERL